MNIFAALLMLLTVLITAPPLKAQQIPTRSYLSFTSADIQRVPVADFQNGTLEQVHLWNCTPANAVLNIKHVYTLGTVTVTNTLAAITASAGKGSTTLTNVYLMPRDHLLFYFSSSATGIVDYVRRVGN